MRSEFCFTCRVLPRNGNSSYCRKCRAIYLREWAKKNTRSIRAATRSYRHRHKDVLARQNYDAKMKRRFKCRQLLGGVCACCGETRDSFLDIDHIHGGGSQQRKLHGPHRTYAEVLSMENPRSKYQLLCSNCNQSKRRLGRCEHESERIMRGEK
jgi:hypothetical protein